MVERQRSERELGEIGGKRKGVLEILVDGTTGGLEWEGPGEDGDLDGGDALFVVVVVDFGEGGADDEHLRRGGGGCDKLVEWCGGTGGLGEVHLCVPILVVIVSVGDCMDWPVVEIKVGVGPLLAGVVEGGGGDGCHD